MNAVQSVFFCNNQCCILKTKTYTPKKYEDIRKKFKKSKAGVFFYDPELQRVLLVQSRGKKWGPPKGTMEIQDNENFVNCAIREVYEETGIQLEAKDLVKSCKIDRAIYFYLERSQEDLCIPTIENNDSTGISWIQVDCLVDMVRNDKIKINLHCRKLLCRFLKIEI